MIKHTLAALLVLTLASAASREATAAESAAAPQMNTGHTANRSPKTSTVSPTADQIEASNVIGANVQNASGADVAKIIDLLIDRRSAAAALAIVTPEGGQSFDRGTSAIAWNSLQFEARPTPHFVARLSGRELAAGSGSVEQAKSGGGYYDLKTDLLGKNVVGAKGGGVGQVQNVVLTLGTGRLVALVIDTGGFISIGANNHAVAWDAARPRLGNGAPIRVALSKTQVEAAPVTATMAPAPIPPNAGETQTQIRRDSAGNISGTKIPAPANSR